MTHASGAPAVSVVVPLFNEEENVPILQAELTSALAGVDYEIIFVDETEDKLNPIGVKGLGEIGIGTNFGIDRPVGAILFDEKIGGTLHLALGRSYPESGGRNVSALHWDLILDLREGGTIWADDEVLQRDGRFATG